MPTDFSQTTQGYFIRHRAWMLKQTPQGVRLASLATGTIWPPGEALEAEHAGGIHTVEGQIRHVLGPEAPCEMCMCGVWGMTGPLLIAAAGAAAPGVTGRVALWGWYVRGYYGMRAQYGYPQAVQSFRCNGCRGLAAPDESVILPARPLPNTRDPVLWPWCNRCWSAQPDPRGIFLSGRRMAALLTDIYGLDRLQADAKEVIE